MAAAASPQPLTPEPDRPPRRCATPTARHPRRPTGASACASEHAPATARRSNEIVAVGAPHVEPVEPTVLVRGPDFVAAPRLQPDGADAAWLQWDHPDMPWDGTELWAASIADDAPLERRASVAGGPTSRSSSRRGRPDGELCVRAPTAPAGGTSTGSTPAATGVDARCVDADRAEIGGAAVGLRPVALRGAARRHAGRVAVRRRRLDQLGVLGR